MSYVVLVKISQANFLALGLAWDFTKPKLPKAMPKLGLSGQAGASTSLSTIKLVNFTVDKIFQMDER